jgi:pectate lyase
LYHQILGVSSLSKIIIALTMHISLSLASAILLAAYRLVDAQSCASCDLEAHGFASLNGGTTGGKGGSIVTAKKLDDLIRYAASSEPLTIRIDGMIKAKPFGFEVPVKSHKTIIGVGAKSGIEEGGLNINGQRNIIIRNLKIHGTYDAKNWAGKEGDYDAIQVDNSTNIWIDGNHVCTSPCSGHGGKNRQMY